MGRYLMVLAVALAIGVGLATVGRPRPRSEAPTAAPAAPVIQVSLAVGKTGFDPSRVSVPVGSEVALALANATDRVVSITVQGYEDRVSIAALAPHSRWTGRFFADRPGDDFAFLLDGAPAGRLVVTGSHLVEGHR